MRKRKFLTETGGFAPLRFKLKTGSNIIAQKKATQNKRSGEHENLLVSQLTERIRIAERLAFEIAKQQVIAVAADHGVRL